MNYKKSSVLGILALTLLPLFMSFVVAADGGIYGDISQPWLKETADFMGWGATWASLIAAIAILAIILSAVYDILAFTAFESWWVKLVIAIGIGLIVSVSKGVAILSGVVFGLAGGVTAVGVGIVIVMAVVFFILSSFLKGWAKSRKAAQLAGEAAAGEKVLGAGLSATAAMAQGAAKAGRGAGKGK